MPGTRALTPEEVAQVQNLAPSHPSFTVFYEGYTHKRIYSLFTKGLLYPYNQIKVP